MATSEYIGPEPEACGGDGLDMGSSSIKFQAASEFDTPNNWLKIGGGGEGGGGSDAAAVRLNLVSLVMTWWLNVHFLPYLQLPLKKFLQIGTESVA